MCVVAENIRKIIAERGLKHKYPNIFPEDGAIECKGKVIGIAELAE